MNSFQEFPHRRAGEHASLSSQTCETGVIGRLHGRTVSSIFDTTAHIFHDAGVEIGPLGPKDGPLWPWLTRFRGPHGQVSLHACGLRDSRPLGPPATLRFESFNLGVRESLVGRMADHVAWRGPTASRES